MATFLVRAFGLETASSAGFTDTRGKTHETAIDALAAANITAGCATDPVRYCPDNSVTRAQMATLLARALNLVPRPAPAGTPQPGEERIGYSALSVDSGQMHIWATNLDGTDRRQLHESGFGWQGIHGPVWSPDGSRIAFYSYPGVVLSSADFTNSRFAIYNQGETSALYAWSPDGTMIAYGGDYSTGDRGLDDGIWVMTADGTNTQLTVIGDGPPWSPDGRRIAYSVDAWLNESLWVMNADGTDQNKTGCRRAQAGVVTRWIQNRLPCSRPVWQRRLGGESGG